MSRLHPQLTHFPITLIITAFIFQIIVLWKPTWMNRTVPLWLLGMGVILAVISGISGQDAANTAINEMTLIDSVRKTIEIHERFANFTIWGSLVFFIGWIWLFFNYPNDKRVDFVAVAFLFLLSLSVGITGYLGGELVMQFGVGVGL